MLEQMHHMADFGLSCNTPADAIVADIQAMVARSRGVSEKLAAGVAHLLKKAGVRVVMGCGVLSKGSRPFHVQVKDNLFQALHVILATGAQARTLPFPSCDVWTAKEALAPQTIPKDLLVIGAGVIGIEFASFYTSLGSKVTIIEQGTRILPTEDEEISAYAQKTFEKKGMCFVLGHTVQNLSKEKDMYTANLSDDNIWIGDTVLVAIGIVGHTQGIGLEKTAVCVKHDHILVNAFQETDQPGLFAIGDVAGPPWLAHKASHEGILCVEYIAGHPVTPLDPLCIPGCIYSQPQIASIGLTQRAAQDKGLSIKVGRFPFSGNGQALAYGQSEGFVKVLFDQTTGELLGAHMIGSVVTELIQGFAIAKTLEATEESLRHVIFPHPTFSEAMHEAVLDADKLMLHGVHTPKSCPPF